HLAHDVFGGFLLGRCVLSAECRGQHRGRRQTFHQWILHPFTGPLWKNFSGVITPSRLNTRPSFITKRTSRNASISASGLPATAIRSAGSPTLIGPRRS